MKKDTRKLFLFIVLILTVGIYMQFNMKKWNWPGILIYDVAGYYSYLPSLFIHGDLATFDSMAEYGIFDISHESFENYGLYYQEETGKYSNKYPVGVAVMQLPFFLIAHQYALLDDSSEANGYSLPYRKATAFSTLFYVALGLFLLGRMLKFWFSSRIVLTTLALLFFGTNLYYYTIFEPGMSHPYLFFLYALCLWATMKFYKRPNYLDAVVIGLSIGLATICRPTDILLALFPLLWPVSKEYNSRWSFMKKYWKNYLIALPAFLMPILLQILYWNYATGNLLFFSYEDEGFVFLKPAIIEGLFSFQKGWFIYTPLALVGFIGAALWTFSPQGKLMDKKSYLVPFWAYYIVSAYILFSWWMWFYGGSFGARIFVQSYALMALPLAILLDRVFIGSRKKILQYALGLTLFWFVFLNIFQTYQHHRGILHHDRNTKAYYWRVFLKLESTEEDRKLLMSDEEMYQMLKERRGH